MTDEQMRIAIADACGIAVYEEPDGSGLWSCKGSYKTGISKEHAQRVSLPDYLNNLNAMHEAEKVLTDDDHRRFRQLLFTGFYNRGEGQTNDSAERARTSATARQRAEAFLKTLNLWKD